MIKMRRAYQSQKGEKDALCQQAGNCSKSFHNLTNLCLTYQGKYVGVRWEESEVDFKIFPSKVI